MDATALDQVMRAWAEAQYGLVGRDQLRAAGASRHSVQRRLQTTAWEAVSPRVLRLVGTAPSDEQRALAATLDAGPGAVVSHASAARLWNVPGFELGQVQVSRDRDATDRPTALARVHHPRFLPDHHRTRRAGIPVTTLARTVIDLAGVEHPARTALALHAALRNGLTWPTLDATLGELEARGRPGIATARALFTEHRGRPPLGSGLEGRVLRILARAGLPEPRRQVDLGGEGWAGRVDLLYDDVRLVIEVNGSWCHESPLDVRRDQRRTAALVAAGFRVLPLPEDLIRRSPAEVVGLVRRARRAAR